MTYRVVAVSNSSAVFNNSKSYMTAKQAHAAALKVGDPVAVYKRKGTHWQLIVDRSVPHGLLPIEQHLANVLGAAA